MSLGQEATWTPEILRGAVHGKPKAVNELAFRLKRSAHTVKTWLSGKHEPKATDLINMMAEYDEVFEAVLSLTKRDINTEAKKRAVRELAALIEGMDADTGT